MRFEIKILKNDGKVLNQIGVYSECKLPSSIKGYSKIQMWF